MSSVALSPSTAGQRTINPWIVAVAVVIPTFMEVLDTTIANVALRYIAGGLSASQDMLTANPNLDVIWGSDQGAEGAASAVASAGKQGKVLIVGGGIGGLATAWRKGRRWLRFTTMTTRGCNRRNR